MMLSRLQSDGLRPREARPKAFLLENGGGDWGKARGGGRGGGARFGKICLVLQKHITPKLPLQRFAIKSLPACRRLLFPLLHAEKGRMRNAVANRGAASRAAKEIGDVCKQAINHDLNASKI